MPAPAAIAGSALLQALLRAGPAAGRFLGLPFKRPKWTGKRPVWQREASGRAPKGRFATGGAKEAGHINRLYMNPTTPMGKAARWGALGVGGSIAADRIANLFSDEEVAADDLKAYRPQFPEAAPSGFDPSSDIETRLQFQKNQTAKYNRQMKKLLRNYGIVNLINPDSAKDMLKIGMAILEQNIAASGDARQAKIFDSVFTPGNMPKSAKEVYDRVMKAGGLEKDASEIAGTYVSMRPPAPAKTSVDQRAMEILRNAQVLYSVGRRGEADDLIRNAILAKIIKVPTESGLEKNIEELIALVRESITGAGGAPRNTGGITITLDEK